VLLYLKLSKHKKWSIKKEYSYPYSFLLCFFPLKQNSHRENQLTTLINLHLFFFKSILNSLLYNQQVCGLSPDEYSSVWLKSPNQSVETALMFVVSHNLRCENSLVCHSLETTMLTKTFILVVRHFHSHQIDYDTIFTTKGIDNRTFVSVMLKVSDDCHNVHQIPFACDLGIKNI